MMRGSCFTHNLIRLEEGGRHEKDNHCVHFGSRNRTGQRGSTVRGRAIYRKPYTLDKIGVGVTLIHHQGIICCVAFPPEADSSLRRIASYASVVAPWRLASDALLVIGNVRKPTHSHKEP